ncbi:hypothetical protein OG992_31765 [Micromonospora sp. NBC_00362]|nr:hypothetical protein [Micromonospora sp. NBC_00362]MCX5121756.1 hypothetical protein [Micromonospora sp. NBC_00362]
MRNVGSLDGSTEPGSLVDDVVLRVPLRVLAAVRVAKVNQYKGER